MPVDLHTHVQELLREDVRAAGSVLAFAVSRDCGSVAVSVLGPRAVLRLFFDQDELDAARVRFEVWRAVTQSRSGLGLADEAWSTVPGRRSC